jgi:hypothetical protein
MNRQRGLAAKSRQPVPALARGEPAQARIFSIEAMFEAKRGQIKCERRLEKALIKQ